jgi:hypothetical protein
MTEDQPIDTGAPTPEPQAAPASPSSAAPAEPEISLESFLSEFERETAAPKQPAEASQPEQPQQPAQPTDYFDKLADDFRVALAGGPVTRADAEALARQVQSFGGLVQNLMAREQHRQDVSDFESVVSKADAMLKDLGRHVDADYARRWLMAESQLTPQLSQAFDDRNKSAEHWRQWQRQEKKLYERLSKSAARQVDQNATEDRFIVAAAVRGSDGRAPEEKPVDITQMSEPEFRNMLRTKWGL